MLKNDTPHDGRGVDVDPHLSRPTHFASRIIPHAFNANTTMNYTLARFTEPKSLKLVAKCSTRGS